MYNLVRNSTAYPRNIIFLIVNNFLKNRSILSRKRPLGYQDSNLREKYFIVKARRSSFSRDFRRQRACLTNQNARPERVHDPGKMVREMLVEFFVFRGIAAFEKQPRNLERGTASASTQNRDGWIERESETPRGTTRRGEERRGARGGEVEREENVGRV